MQPWMVGATLVCSAANLAATVSQISPASFSNLDLGDGAVLHDNPLGGTWHDNPLMGSAMSTPRDSPRPPRLVLPGDAAAGRAPSALVRACVCPSTGSSGHFLVDLHFCCSSDATCMGALSLLLISAPVSSNTGDASLTLKHMTQSAQPILTAKKTQRNVSTTLCRPDSVQATSPIVCRCKDHLACH